MVASEPQILVVAIGLSPTTRNLRTVSAAPTRSFAETVSWSSRERAPHRETKHVLSIRRSESLQNATRRVAREQLSKAIREIEDRTLDTDSTVHQVRKRIKKLRGLLRIVRPGLGKVYKRENDSLRDAARLFPICVIRECCSAFTTI